MGWCCDGDCIDVGCEELVECFEVFVIGEFGGVVVMCG